MMPDPGHRPSEPPAAEAPLKSSEDFVNPTGEFCETELWAFTGVHEAFVASRGAGSSR